ncbi:MAG: hypothetical protein ACYSU5_03525, partial [Planctomycetota bacterium]
YTAQAGSLQVTILPQAAIDAGAQWRVDGGTWRDSDYTEPNLAVGQHTVEYSVIAGFNEPNNRTGRLLTGHNPAPGSYRRRCTVARRRRHLAGQRLHRTKSRRRPTHS